MANHLATLRPPATLNYNFRKSGSMEQGFQDQVKLSLRANDKGGCCLAVADFLKGANRVTLPEIEADAGNPVILYFLERDIREMERLTKGKPNYFRKRIRMAVYQNATMREVTATYRGRSVNAREVSISPYLDDPLRARFEKLINKRYVFTLSDAVPGGVVNVRTQVVGPDGAALLTEEMTLEEATPPTMAATPAN